MIRLFFMVRKYVALNRKYKAHRYINEYKAIHPLLPLATWECVTTVTTMANIKDSTARKRNIRPRARANSLPTELFFSQCGHLASWLTNELNRNVSPQWPQFTRHIPGMGEMSLVFWVFFAVGEYKTIIFLHDARGHEILCAVDLHMSKQLHGHLMYFWPDGGLLIGCFNETLRISSLDRSVVSTSPW